MIYASTFLSHSSADKSLVERVAVELGRRGVIAWLDKNELLPGVNLTVALREAIRRQATVTIFLSSNSVASRWVEDELKEALQMDEQNNNKFIVPIYLDDPLTLVKAHLLLRQRWLHPDGKRVTQLGITSAGRTLAEKSKDIATKLAGMIYDTLAIKQQSDVIIYLDQRGDGQRRGETPNLPQNARNLEAPVLLFRPDLGPRSKSETLYGADWEAVRDNIRWALGEALTGTHWPQPKNIYLYGASQLGLAFLIGHHFDRNTSAFLYCTNRDGKVFNNCGQPRHAPLTGGNPYCETPHPDIQPIPKNARLSAISLLLSTDFYVGSVLAYLGTQTNSPPPVWIKHDCFSNDNQVMNHIANVVALLTRFRNDHGANTVYLYCSLPFNVVPLLAANLLHVMDTVIFMEYRYDLKGTQAPPQDMYVPLLMK